mgnify:CR=1 FL=1
MNESIKETIYYYKTYLNKKRENNKTNINNISNDIEHDATKTKNELKTLEKLSEKYKLYDENYNDFMISMGELALKIENIDKINMDNKNKERYINEFIKMHKSFEELEQVNIMKDVYIWKFISKKEKTNE